MENSMEFPQKIKIKMPYYLAIPFQGIYPDKNIIWKYTYTPMFIVALFIIAKIWKPPKCPLTHEWIKMWCVCVNIYMHTHTHIYWNIAHACSFQLCPTLCDPMYYTLSGSFAHGDSLGKTTGVGAMPWSVKYYPSVKRIK